MDNKITFASGQTLSVGDVFYYTSPEWHDGTIEKCTVDSFAMGEPHYGCHIRFTTENRSEYSFVWQQFFERENPTCFLRLEDAQRAADENLYSDLRRPTREMS